MQDFETKYTALNSQAVTIKSWLERNFRPDPSYPEAIITSIYFDTKSMSHLREKVNSDHIKSKFRIRWYEDLESRVKSEACFLEFKHKIGEKRYKRRIKEKNIYSELNLESSRFHGVFDELRLYEGKVLDHLFPSFIVSYTRKRFVVPGSSFRLCIDYNINVPKTNRWLVGRDSKKKYLNNCVFELKGQSAILPKELHFLESLGLKKSSFSKYERCYVELIDSAI